MDQPLMAGDDQDAGLPELEICDDIKLGDAANKMAVMLEGPIQDLRKVVDNIESLARSLKANQRRSKFRTIK